MVIGGNGIPGHSFQRSIGRKEEDGREFYDGQDIGS